MRIVAGLLAMLLVVGCSDKDNIPSGIIPRDEMEKILWDMVQADQYSSLYLLKDSARINVKEETLKLYQEVFLLHQVSREEFSKSFQYYQEHPELTRNVFDSLLTRGNRLRTESYSRPVLTTPKPVGAPPMPATTGPAFSKPVGMPPRNPVMGGRMPAGTTPGKPVNMPGKSAITPGKLPGNRKPVAADTVRGKQPG